MKHWKRHQGMAVFGVLILIVVSVAIFLAVNQGNLSVQKIASLIRKNITLQNQAETGSDIAKGMLIKLAENNMENQYSGSSLASFSNPGDGINPVEQGYVYDSDRSTLTALIDSTQGSTKTLVYLFPEDPNPAIDWSSDPTEYDGEYPKRFLIVSQAENTQTGESFSIETLVEITEEPFSEILYGILGSGGVPSEFYIEPGIFEGRVHFNLDPTELYMNSSKQIGDLVGYGIAVNEGMPSSPTYEEAMQYGYELDDQAHYYLGHVTFANSTPSGQEYPFKRTGFAYDDSESCTQDCGYGERYTEILFQEGYSEGYDKVKPLDTSYFSNLIPNADVDFTGSGKTDVCLKFINTVGGAKLKEYTCNTDQPYVWDRYVGEEDDVRNGTDSSIATYDAGGLIACGDCDVHIKGIVADTTSVVAQNVYIEGDLVYQDPYNNMLGVMAINDIVVPDGVPQHERPMFSNMMAQTIDSYNPLNSSSQNGLLRNITNFIPEDSNGDPIDLDIEDTTYPAQWMYKAALQGIGFVNGAATLDLEGHFIAGNYFRMQGIWQPEMDADKAIGIMATEDGGATWDRYLLTEWDQPNSFYITDPMDPSKKIPRPGIEPAFYRDGHLNKTPKDGVYDYGEEFIRIPQGQLHIRGSANHLYAYSSRLFNQQTNGFFRRVHREDKRVDATPPLFFPRTGEVVIGSKFTKSYKGKSSLIPQS
ncbi:MAG: hypothetical protein KDD52_00450 [Bdellovibrionales bacterium]|nr:hypothetical protein [Bdellovibrionales bacterium]